MTLPDDYAGGMFNVPLRVAKLVRLADSTDSEPERQNAREQINKRGYFLDRASVLWEKNKVPKFAQDKETTDVQ